MKNLRLTFTILSLAALTALSASAQIIPAQDNPWTTNNATQIDFSNFGSVNLTIFFGSSPTNSVVTFVGTPLNSQLGTADTLVRSEQVDVTTGANSTTITVEALSLASSPNLTLADGRVYHITTSLAYPGTGTGTFTRLNSDGGTYDSSFTVTPIFKFTNVNNANDVQTIDCSQSANSCSFAMSGSGNPWTLSQQGGFDPSTMNIPVVPSGVVVGSYTTVGRPQFNAIYPGIAGSKATGYTSPIQQEMETAGNTWHKVAPPQPRIVVKCLPEFATGTSVAGPTAPGHTRNSTLSSGPTGDALLCIVPF